MTTDKKKLFRETEARLHNYKYLEIQINSLELDIDEKIYHQYIYDKAITDTLRGKRRK